MNLLLTYEIVSMLNTCMMLHVDFVLFPVNHGLHCLCISHSSWEAMMPFWPIACFQLRNPVTVNVLSHQLLPTLNILHGKQNAALRSLEYSNQ